jgi:hypothetical protein
MRYIADDMWLDIGGYTSITTLFNESSISPALHHFGSCDCFPP